MKFHLYLISLLCALCFDAESMTMRPDVAGFAMPDSINEVTIRYRKVNNLILLPVMINDSVKVNLILDTGCRNIILFGRRHTKVLKMQPSRLIEFSGLGTGRSVTGNVSLGNKVNLGAVVGRQIPIVVVPNTNLFDTYANVDGIIGYDVFIKFEIEFSQALQSVIFRPAMTATLSDDYVRIPIRVADARAVIPSTLTFPGIPAYTVDVLIDTGSSLGLLLKTTDNSVFGYNHRMSILGRGLNGPIEGFTTATRKVLLGDVEMSAPVASVVHSPWPDEASVGMDVLGRYNFVLNYCRGYIGIKKEAKAAKTMVLHSPRSENQASPRYF